ncbi:hypothetical protein [Haloferax chudinovii]|uniref:Uncharacterized protein n=1 Tax=Haloferax chudinovii TaxID=1109010 RepID=A0ABD5XL94_9EURY
MKRRTFIQSTAIGLGLGVGDVGAMSSHGELEFIDEFGYGVADFFHNSWGVGDLEDELEEVVDFTCYAYGEIEELGSDEEQETPKEPGFLDGFQTLALEELDDNPETYDWILNHIEDVVTLLDYIDVFPDDLGEKLDGVTTYGKKLTKFIPLVANVKQILDTGCNIYDKISAGKSPSESTYVEFFKYVALTIIEVILLVTGASVSYRVAFGATGWANRRMINVVGRRLGWRAYSWVLSQVHWGVRISFAEGLGQAISDVTEIVSQQLVSASTDAGNPLSKSEAQEIAKNDVRTMAAYTDGWGMAYETWKLGQWRKRQIREASQQREQITEQVDTFLESLPI